MLNCRNVSALVSKGMDKELNLSERLAVQAHLMICSGCRNFKKQSLLLRKISHHYLNHLQNKSDQN